MDNRQHGVATSCCDPSGRPHRHAALVVNDPRNAKYRPKDAHAALELEEGGGRWAWAPPPTCGEHVWRERLARLGCSSALNWRAHLRVLERAPSARTPSLPTLRFAPTREPGEPLASHVLRKLFAFGTTRAISSGASGAERARGGGEARAMARDGTCIGTHCRARAHHAPPLARARARAEPSAAPGITTCREALCAWDDMPPRRQRCCRTSLWPSDLRARVTPTFRHSRQTRSACATMTKCSQRTRSAGTTWNTC